MLIVTIQLRLVIYLIVGSETFYWYSVVSLYLFC